MQLSIAQLRQPFENAQNLVAIVVLADGSYYFGETFTQPFLNRFCQHCSGFWSSLDRDKVYPFHFRLINQPEHEKQLNKPEDKAEALEQVGNLVKTGENP